MESLVTQDFLEKFYKGKKVFVTGHTGFKGGWLIAWLHLLGAQIKGYALSPENEFSIYNVISPHVPHESVISDVRNKEKLRQEMLDFEPDFVFHLAAQALVRHSYKAPSQTFDVNVVGTANLLESLIGWPKKCTTLVITTDKVYENQEHHLAYNETDRLGGHDPYSASKACAELVTESFSKSFFDPGKFVRHQKIIATARAGNVIGGGDYSTDRITPDIVRHLVKNEKIPVRNPKSVRPWQHVLEPLGGYLLAGGLLDNDPSVLKRAYNFGPEIQDHITVQQLVEMSIKHWGYGGWIDLSNKQEPHEAGILKLDISLAKKDLKWYPKLSSKLAVEWTIAWYKKEKKELFDFTLQQIKMYQSK